MGKIKLKKVVFLTYLAVFSAIYGFQPIRTLELIDINDYKLTPFNQFCYLPAQFLHGPLITSMKRKKNCTPDEHTSSIIIRSKLNLLTEPQNNNKQVALFILLLRVNSSFLVGEIFKRSCIICIKKTTLVGMKISNYHFSCYYANLGQFYRDRIKFFLRLIGYFCAQPVCFCYQGFDFLS